MMMFTCEALSYDGVGVFGWPITIIENNGKECPAIFQPDGCTYVKVIPSTIKHVKPERPHDYIDGAVELLKEYAKIPKEERREK